MLNRLAIAKNFLLVVRRRCLTTVVGMLDIIGKAFCENSCSFVCEK